MKSFYRKPSIFMQTLFVLAICLVIQACSNTPNNWQWETIEAIGAPTPRHEAAFVSYQDKMYLIGGRRINPTDEFDPATKTWTAKSPTPIELHHFQPVVVGDAIYLMGAMTGLWPNEKPLDKVLVYYPERDEYEYKHEIPENRRRGGAGVVYHNGKIYMVGGITNGHMDGFMPWFDEYDPQTGEWRVLPNAPNSRDHFQAVVIGNKLYAFGGRVSSRATGEDMSRTIQHGNIFDFQTEVWLPVTANHAIPTMRAGTASLAWNDEVVVAGGESMTQELAHNQVESFNSQTGQWVAWPPLAEGRHGSGFAIIDDYVYIASGSGGRGGGPELTSIERLKLPRRNLEIADKEKDISPVYSQWHTVDLSFEGPELSETGDINPFLDYQLIVSLENAGSQYHVRGFFAADNQAAETGAASGKFWKARFTPDTPGNWSYTATLYHGDSVALNPTPDQSLAVPLSNTSGTFVVTPTDTDGPDFRAYGRIVASDGYFKFYKSDKYWIKGGADSPENFLAYQGFDDTYRTEATALEGEASTDNTIHSYPSHQKDWTIGDPDWKGGQGKAIIGAINYLASKGMNVVYFLLNNINGDGRDVWPYVSPEDFTRFDVSKLEQWDILFSHMQSKGIMLHMVLQETENETMLDNGNTGPLRKLFLNEMIARYGHHLGLTWNLGEENGPAPFSPIAQNDQQRRDMTSFIKQNDPYNHPVLLHTHSHDPPRAEVLNQILGFQDLDGLSLQQDNRKEVSPVIQQWRKKSIDAGNHWLISMDEIGYWHTGAKSDAEDPDHPTLRRYVLWGSLLSGAAGVEWYFGANSQQNDLSTEDWRTRDRLWELTYYALEFFDKYLPYWEMEPTKGIANNREAYSLAKTGQVYAIYFPEITKKKLTANLRGVTGSYSIHWYDPTAGGDLQAGSVEQVDGNQVASIGFPPGTQAENRKKDWVVLIERINED